MQIFATIKERVSVPEAAQFYGVHINRHGKALCPFHNEKTPSFSVRERNWYCFGCGEGGDVISLVQRLNALPAPLDAARRLDTDFRLNLFSGKLSGAELTKARQAAEKYTRDKGLADSFNRWCKDALSIVTRHLWYLQDIIERDAPRSPDDEFAEDFAAALRDLAAIENLYDELAFGDLTERISVYKYSRKRVRDIDYKTNSARTRKTA